MPIFTANIPGLLKVGDKIEIGGKIKENARKMSVNLCAQEGEEPRDVVLHFDVRFHRDNIISLSRKNGIWIGSGNYDTNYNMFVPGTVFRIVFEIKDTDVITIYCQGKFHSNFLPKIPLSMARYIVAWADVDRVTHCYFHLGNKVVSGDEPPAVVPSMPMSPRAAAAARAIGDMKRKERKKSPGGSCRMHSSNESSDDDVKGRQKDGRADRFFYDTLMCQPTSKFRHDVNVLRMRPEHSRKYHEASDAEVNDTEEFTEETPDSKDLDSSVAESEVPELKKISRRGKFGSIAHVVNFMGKNSRKN